MDEKLELNLIQRIALGDILRSAALRQPNKEALVGYRGESRISLTYKDL